MISTVITLTTGLEQDGRNSFSFDTDNDHIDDSIEGNGPFHVILHLSDGAARSHVRDLVGQRGGSIGSFFTIVNVATAVLPNIDAVKSIAGSDHIAVIEAQIMATTLMEDSVPAVKAAPSLEYSPQTAHDLGFTGSGVTIAIIDTGVDNEHPLLQGSFVAGVDFTRPSTPLSPRDGTFDPDDRSGHGTGVASIALGREVEGLAGAAPDAGLIDLKIVTALNQDVNPISDEFLLSLQWCMDNAGTDWGHGYKGVDVVSISLGVGPGDGALGQAIDELVGNGIVVVQSAGNSAGPYSDQNQTSWPDRAIIVAGLDNKQTVDREDDEIWSTSTSGPRTDDGDEDPMDELKPDLAAPAVGMTFASHSQTSNVQPASGMSQGSGTSYATPHVSGTVALMLEANPGIKPSDTQNPVKLLLHRSSEPGGEPTFPDLSDQYNADQGWGSLDAAEAVKAARVYSDVNHRPQINSFTAEPSVTTTGSTVTLTVKAVDIDEDPLTYELEVDAGTYTGNGPIWQWTAPVEPGNYSFFVIVTDPFGAKDQLNTGIEVQQGSPNRPPVITTFTIEDRTLGVGETTKISVVAFDPDDDPLDYEYDTITGTIQGTGPEVTYVAPTTPGTDTVSVIVTDQRGASARSEMIISIMEDQTNSPPSISLLSIDPPEINASNVRNDVILKVQVEDPDGPEDILLVTADLSGLGGSDGAEMKDDGMNPDNRSGDGEFSLRVTLPDPPENGIYTIIVNVYDKDDGEATETINLVISIESAGDVSSGKSSGPDMMVVGIVLVILFIIILVVIVVIVMRGRRKRIPAQYAPHPTMNPVRYRPSSSGEPPIYAMPPEGQQPKFNIVSGR